MKIFYGGVYVKPFGQYYGMYEMDRCAHEQSRGEICNISKYPLSIGRHRKNFIFKFHLTNQSTYLRILFTMDWTLMSWAYIFVSFNMHHIEWRNDFIIINFYHYKREKEGAKHN